MKSLLELGRLSNATGWQGDVAVRPTGVVYDSRQVKPGDLFVALRGGYFDGHNFIDRAIEQGAVAVAAEVVTASVSALLFADMRASLPDLAAAFFDFPGNDLKVIGITGTDGKTTTSYLTDAILTAHQVRTGMIGTVSVKIAGESVDHETRQTTPESLDIQRYLARMRDADVEWTILEATSHGLAAHRLDGITFDIAAVTNVTHEHLEFHGSIEAYRSAKASLFERAGASGGWAVINLDDPVSRSFADVATGANLLTYSRSGAPATLVASQLVCGASGSTFQVESEWGRTEIRLPYPGEFNVENALCAIGIAVAAGVPFDSLGEALEWAPPVPGRMAAVDENQPFSVIVDYAHTPESLEKILTLLRRLTTGKIICVSGSAGERDVEKRPMQGEVSARLADLSVFTTEDPRFEDAASIIDDIAEGARRLGKTEGSDFVCIVDRQEAIDFAILRAQTGDIVLLAGKGHERSIIWGHEKRPWDEAAAARLALSKLGYATDSPR